MHLKRKSATVLSHMVAVTSSSQIGSLQGHIVKVVLSLPVLMPKMGNHDQWVKFVAPVFARGNQDN